MYVQIPSSMYFTPEWKGIPTTAMERMVLRMLMNATEGREKSSQYSALGSVKMAVVCVRCRIVSLGLAFPRAGQRNGCVRLTSTMEC